MTFEKKKQTKKPSVSNAKATFTLKKIDLSSWCDSFFAKLRIVYILTYVDTYRQLKTLQALFYHVIITSPNFVNYCPFHQITDMYLYLFTLILSINPIHLTMSLVAFIIQVASLKVISEW